MNSLILIVFFQQIPNKIPKKKKLQGASTVPIGAKPYDPNEDDDDDDWEWVKVVVRLPAAAIGRSGSAMIVIFHRTKNGKKLEIST